MTKLCTRFGISPKTGYKWLQRYRQERTAESALANGLAEGMIMDNGSPWGDEWETRHTIFTTWLIRLGIVVSHSRP